MHERWLASAVLPVLIVAAALGLIPTSASAGCQDTTSGGCDSIPSASPVRDVHRRSCSAPHPMTHSVLPVAAGSSRGARRVGLGSELRSAGRIDVGAGDQADCATVPQHHRCGLVITESGVRLGGGLADSYRR